jgi:hypothetical protein
MMQGSRKHRSGFMTMVTLVVLGIVTAAMVGMTMAANLDHRRTESELGQAQLRQLLLAGTQAVRADTIHLNVSAAKWKIDIPDTDSSPEDAAASRSTGVLPVPSDTRHGRDARAATRLGNPAQIALTAESRTAGDGTVSVRLIATIGTHHLEEQLQLRRDDDQWTVLTASLN